MTQTLLHAGLVNAALALLLAVPAALASRFLRRRPAVAHGLWLLVLVKLVTPPLIEVPLFATPEEPAPRSVPEVVVLDRCPFEAAAAPEPMQIPPPSTEETAPPPPAPIDWRTPLLAAWLAGAGGVWLLAFARLGRLERVLAQLSPANGDLQDRVRRLSTRIGLRRAPGLWLVPGVVPPLLVAVFRAPRLLVPAGLWDRLDDAQRDALLLHELAHLRRGDPWVRLVEVAVVGLFWWYPLGWWAGRALRDAEELCCDAWVVWAMPESAGAYAGALVETVGYLSGANAALPLVASGAAPVRCLQRRLTMILRHPPSRRLSPAGLFALVVAGACVLPLVPGLAQTETPVEDRGPAVERLVLESPSCRSCHQAASWKDPFGGPQAKEPGRLHQDIVKLLNELTAQRAQVAKTEQRLRKVLGEFEAATGKKPQPAKGSDRRLDDLEKKLEGVLKELQELRRERRPPQPRSARPTASAKDVMHINQRSFQIPIHIDSDRKQGVRETILLASRDEGASWETSNRALPTAKAFDFVAHRDGRYLFRVEAVDSKGRVEDGWGRSAALAVHVDTVRPEIEMTAQVKGRWLEVTWKIIEENPNLEALKLEYRLVDSGEWRPLAVKPMLAGQHRFYAEGKVAELRMRAADLAGNSAETKLLLASDNRTEARASSRPTP